MNNYANDNGASLEQQVSHVPSAPIGAKSEKKIFLYPEVH
jgi:hypothetical protein